MSVEGGGVGTGGSGGGSSSHSSSTGGGGGRGGAMSAIGADSAMRFLSTGFKSVTDVTKRGAIQTFDFTKHVTKSVISDMTKLTSKVPRGNGLIKKMDVRKVFRARHSSALGAVALVEDDEVSSDSDEEFTDEQVQERVDKKYFDPTFRGMEAELAQLPVSYADEDGEVTTELETLDTFVRERTTQIRVVNSTLKNRILKNYDVFINGVMQIGQVSDDLVRIREECVQGRQRLGQAKQTFVVDGLAIPVNRRRRANFYSIKEIGEQMAELHDKYTLFTAMLEARNLTEAITIIREPLKKADLNFLRRINSMREVIEQWETFSGRQSIAMLDQIERCIEECIAVRFRASRYKEALEASLMMDDQDHAIERVVLALHNTTEVIIFRSVAEVSECREIDKGLAAIISGVMPEHLMLCFCQLSGKMADFIALFSNVCRVHVEEAKHSLDAARVQMHKSALDYVKVIGKRIGANLHANLVEILENARFGNLDLEKVLHCFHIIMMLVEASVVLGCDKDTMATARAGVKQCLCNLISTRHQPQRGELVCNFMEGETWEADPMRGANLRVVAPISPDAYKACVKSVKQYVSGGDDDTQRPENPFFSKAFTEPPNISDGITIQDFKPTAGRDILTTTAVHIASNIFEYVCRAAVRFPPLAGEVLDWCEDLVALYVYIAAANFVSVSRSTPLEEQADFSPETRAHLAAMRKAALRAAPHLNQRGLDGTLLFPPAVFDGIADVYGNQAAYFGIVHRAVAVEGAFPLVEVLRRALDSISPLMSISAQKEKKASIDALELCIEELLHVGMHRLSAAVFPPEDFVTEITKTKFDNRDEMKPSPYVARIAMVFKNFYTTFSVKFPSKYTNDVFWARLVFVLQQSLCRAYGKISKKTSDLIVSQMMVDVQSFNQRVREFLPAEALIIGDYCTTFLRAYFEKPEDRVAWMRKNHTQYVRNDLVYWLSNGDRDRRHELEKVLDELHHIDMVPLKQFLNTLRPRAA